MKLETQLKDDHQINIIAEFDQDLLEQHKKRAARKISGQTKIPGFRPGKAPYAMILRQFGEEVVLEEALESLVNEVYPQIIDEAGIKPYGPGALDDILTKEPPKFSFTIPLMPEVSLYDYRSIRKDYNFESASEEEINEVLMNLQIQQAVNTPVEDRPAQLGDIVEVDISGTYVNPDEGQNSVFLKDRTLSVYLNAEFDHKHTRPYQGFMNELIGLQKDEQKTCSHTFNELDKEEDPETYGKEVEFTFIVKSISQAELPVLSDEFAQTISTEMATLDDLKKSIAGQIESYRKEQYEDGYLTAVLDEIVPNSTVKYPPQLFDAEAEEYIKQVEQTAAQQGMEFEAYLKTQEKSREDLIAEQREQIEEKIHRMLVLEEIARAEEIKLDPEELQANVAEATMRYGLFQYMRQLPKKQADELAQRITINTANQLFNDKLMHRLIDIASGNLEKVTETTETAETAADEPTKTETE